MVTPKTFVTRHVLRVLALLSLVALASCAPRFDQTGYVPDPEDLAALRLGVDTRESVIEAVGSPTTGSVLSDDFYYIRSKFRLLGLFEPEEIERELVAMNFDSRGVLRNIESYGLEDGRAVVLSRRVTDDGLRDRTFLRQLLGNIGRVNAEDIFGAP